jgi:hypothetical protein
MNPKVVLLGYNFHINSKKLIPERGFTGLKMILKNPITRKVHSKITEIINS